MLQHVNASCSIGAHADVAAFRIVHYLGVDHVSIVSRSCPDRVPMERLFRRAGSVEYSARARAAVRHVFRYRRSLYETSPVGGRRRTRCDHGLDPSGRRQRHERLVRGDIPARERHRRRVRRCLRHGESGSGAAGDHRRRWRRHGRARARRLGARLGRCRLRHGGRGRRQCHRRDPRRLDRRHP